MINFKLADIQSFSTEGQHTMCWFWLTEANLWLSFGETTVYEYSKEALAYFENKPTPYNDYPLVRFIDDFTDIFDRICEKVPNRFFQLTTDMESFKANANKWLDLNDTDEDEHSDFYFEEYDKLISWLYQRTFDSGHLIGGPHLSFFRHQNIIRIVWLTDYKLENDISIWTAKNGFYDMEYSIFIQNIKDLGESFFEAMGKQVEQAIEKDWGNMQIDKKRLLEEHKERELDFYSKLALLNQEPAEKTDWVEIGELYDRMKVEIKND